MGADAVFVGLRRLGRRVEYRCYRGRHHSPISWSEPAYRDLVESVIRWLDQHLGNSRSI